MSAIDWIFLAIIGVSGLFGLLRGFVGVVASFIAWVLAAWTAFRFGGAIGVFVAGGQAPTGGEAFVGYAISFVGVFATVALLSMLVRRALQAAGLLGVDRMLGLALGTARGIFIAAALVLLVSFTPLIHRASYRQSVLAPMLGPLAGAMRDWMPSWAEARANVEGERRQIRAPSGGVLGMPSAGDLRRQMQSGDAQGAMQPSTAAQQQALERAVLPALDSQLRAVRAELRRPGQSQDSRSGPSSRMAPTPQPASAATDLASTDPASADRATAGDAAAIER